MVEYVLIAGLIAVVSILAITAVGGNVNRIFGVINTALTPVGA
jgi:Flp pilus assembly pilin Flp